MFYLFCDALVYNRCTINVYDDNDDDDDDGVGGGGDTRCSRQWRSQDPGPQSRPQNYFEKYTINMVS